jgi:hypothetical protein
MKVVLYFFSSLLFGCAMDYTCTAELVNHSSDSIKVSILFDKQGLDKSSVFQSVDYIKAIKYYNKKIGYNVDFDSVILKSVFSIPKNGKSEIIHTPGGRGVSPDYSIIKEITIFSHDQINVYSRGSLDTLFQNKEDWLWQYIIK